MRKRRRRSRQIEIRYRSHGGKRKGAGRKRSLPGRKRVAHRKRAVVNGRCPVHVTTRVRREVPGLRNFERCRIIRDAMFAVRDEPGFRICEFSVQGNHLHLICEARSNAALSRGMKRFKQRVARQINKLLDRKGSLFVDRYQMEVMGNPRQVRNTLCYVLHNARRHGLSVERSLGGIDPYSSGRWFKGWKDPPAFDQPYSTPCVSRARTWLLTTGWQQWGLIGVDEVPSGTRRSGARAG